MSKGIFITATGTDVGKTYVAALITKLLRANGINAGYYKAALSGADTVDGQIVPGDCKFVADAAGLGANFSELVSYVYKTAVSPHLAARLENKPVEFDVIVSDFEKLKKKFDFITVEGSGGIVCPLRLDDKKLMLTDIIKRLNLGVIIVSGAELGAINSAVLTAEYAKNLGITVKGIILNNYDSNNFLHTDNKKAIERLAQVKVIACVGKNGSCLKMKASLLCELYGEV